MKGGQYTYIDPRKTYGAQYISIKVSEASGDASSGTVYLNFTHISTGISDLQGILHFLAVRFILHD